MNTSTTFLIASVFGLLTSCSGTRPSNLGVQSGALQKCPEKPNCVVSSDGVGEEHAIEAILTNDDPQTSMQKLVSILNSMDGVTIISSEKNYLRAEFKSSLMGFVDDVEFYQASGSKKIQIRSASRVGYSDMGVNRKRMELIRKSFK